MVNARNAVQSQIHMSEWLIMTGWNWWGFIEKVPFELNSEKQDGAKETIREEKPCSLSKQPET